MYVKGIGFEAISKTTIFLPELSTVLYAFENEDMIARAKFPKIRQAGVLLTDLYSAICWAMPSEVESAVVATGILANPVSMRLERE